jgi:ribosomal protein S8
MINYKIGDLVTRINTIYSNSTSVLYENGQIQPNKTKVERGVDIPLTKDNYQIICQLIKLGILQDLDPTNQKLGFCHVKFNSQNLVDFPPSPLGEGFPYGGARGLPEGLKKPIKNLFFRMTLISKPGRRIYISYKDLNSFNFGFQLFLLRTSQGIITSQTALKNKIGGELLLKISFVAAP